MYWDGQELLNMRPSDWNYECSLGINPYEMYRQNDAEIAGSLKYDIEYGGRLPSEGSQRYGTDQDMMQDFAMTNESPVEYRLYDEL